MSEETIDYGQVTGMVHSTESFGAVDGPGIRFIVLSLIHIQISIKPFQRLPVSVETASSVLVPIPMSRPVRLSQLQKRVSLHPSVLTITCNFSVKLKIAEKPIKKSAKKFQNKEKPMSQYKIAPSILAADYANFEREIKRLEACLLYTSRCV